MKLSQTIDQVRANRPQAPARVALVPTMGALHEGHLVHLDRCRDLADHLIVSIFVNPTQFGPNEDYQQYPRQLERDLEACRDRGADEVFAPTVEQMYPPNVPAARIEVPELIADLEGTWRPGHFAGVCRVVAKLLNIVQPDVASFGLKDYQQLRVIEAMAADMAMPVRIERIPTVRESDGLALSSRNRYLDPDQRRHALGLYKALCQAKMLVEQSGETNPAEVEEAMAEILEAHQLLIDYAVLRHPQTLAELDCIEPDLTHGVVALIAARLGTIRLIDNMLLAGPEPR